MGEVGWGRKGKGSLIREVRGESRGHVLQGLWHLRRVDLNKKVPPSENGLNKSEHLFKMNSYSFLNSFENPSMILLLVDNILFIWVLNLGLREIWIAAAVVDEWNLSKERNTCAVDKEDGKPSWRPQRMFSRGWFTVRHRDSCPLCHSLGPRVFSLK